MLRIISCLDIKNNFVVKGKKFKKLEKISSPIKLILYYELKKVDEIVLLDITSNYTKKSLSNKLIKKISKKITIPLAIGGGVNSIERILELLRIGADRIIINSYCYCNINLIRKISNLIGSQSLIIAIDVKKKNNNYLTYKNSGFINTNFLIKDWVIILNKFGAGELLVTSIDKDGMCSGFYIDLYVKIKNISKISIIISGGMGCINDIYYLYKYCKINTFLIAGLFHKKLINPNYIKTYFKQI